MTSHFVKYIIIFLIFALHILPLKAQDIRDFSTNLPLIIIDTQGKTIPDEPKIYARMKIINNSNGENRFTDFPNEYNGHIGIEKRGSSSISCPFTASPEWAENSGYKIYPNPAASQLNIQAANPVSGLLVYNLSGKLVLSKNALNAQVIYIDVSQFDAGVYLLKLVDFDAGVYLLKLVDNNGQAATEKIVIQ